MAPKGLLERLASGEKVVVAEGYLFNFERRGYLQAGPFVPTVVLDHPELVTLLHEEFVRAGSDVVQALTYYAHREKLAVIDREDDVEVLNRTALRIAKGVAEKTNTLLAGNISNTFIENLENPENRAKLKQIFKEQLDLAIEEGVDFIIAETFGTLGIPCVVTMAPRFREKERGRYLTLDNVEITEAMKRLESAGADVVGLNCLAGPEITMNYMEIIKKSGVKVPLACLPVPYRTTHQEPTFLTLRDNLTGEFLFPCDLDCAYNSRNEIYDFGRKCDELGVQYMGLCCGNSAAFTRTLCESIGRTPPASKFSPRMDLHGLFGDDEKVMRNKKAYDTFENIVA